MTGHPVPPALLGDFLARLSAVLTPEDVQYLSTQMNERLSTFTPAYADSPTPKARMAAAALDAKMEALQEMYPLRAAALYLRTVIFTVATLFEENRLHRLDGETMLALIDCLHRAESVIEERCVNCPLTHTVRN